MARRIDTPRGPASDRDGRGVHGRAFRGRLRTCAGVPGPGSRDDALRRPLLGMIHPMDHWYRPDARRSPADVADISLNGHGAR
jgi:hypothetical protein